MTLVQLQYVLAVAEQKNFTLAADKSFVTQPTLSMQIQKLEKELNIEIFDRSTHPIKITQIGGKVVAQAKIILREASQMKHLVNEEKGLLEGEFNIGVIPTILPTLVPMFYKNFQRSHPKSTLFIRELQTEQIIKEIKDGTLDFGILVSPLQEDQIIEKHLYYEPLVAYIPKDHKFHERETIKEKDLNPSDLLLLQEGHCFRNNVLSMCEPSKIKSRPVKLESGSFETLVKLANDGYGMTILPSLHAEELSEELQKNIRRFEEPQPSRDVSLVYHKSQLRDSFEKELIKTIQGILRGKIFLKQNDNITSPTIKKSFSR